MDSDDEVPQLISNDEPEAGPSSPRRGYDRRRVPITLLTGYLGAGKSTLLDYILTADHGYKIAVCMNDFGDTTDIETKTLTLTDPTTKAQTSQFLSLPNGCLCCSFKDMGIAAVEEMAHQEGVDWVMVELTGLADPAPIAKTFWENEEMGDLELDGVVCVVDCRNVLKHLAEVRPDGSDNEAQRQIACGDVILLNKTDLVEPAQVNRVRKAIRRLNPTLKVFETVHSRAPLADIFSIRAYTSVAFLRASALDAVPSGKHVEDCDADHGPNRATDHAHNEPQGQVLGSSTNHAHHGDISTISVPLPILTPEQFTRLNNFLESFLWSARLPDLSGLAPSPPPRTEVLRTKGYVQVADGREYVLQGVTDIFDWRELSPTAGNSVASPGAGGGAAFGRTEGEAGGKVVFIGRGLGQFVSDHLLAYLES